MNTADLWLSVLVLVVTQTGNNQKCSENRLGEAYILCKNKRSLEILLFKDTHPYKYILLFWVWLPPSPSRNKSLNSALEYFTMSLQLFELSSLFLSLDIHKSCSSIII